MKYPYSMVIQWSDEDQLYIVTLPEFGPYSSTHGSTYDEAVKNGQEALESLIEANAAEGEPLPEAMKFNEAVIELKPAGRVKRVK